MKVHKVMRSLVCTHTVYEQITSPIKVYHSSVYTPTQRTSNTYKYTIIVYLHYTYFLHVKFMESYCSYNTLTHHKF